VALRLWNGALPPRPPEELVRELYRAENEGHAEPSGSQDMVGLIYPGINRRITTPRTRAATFRPHRVHLRPRGGALAGERPAACAGESAAEGYNPLGVKNLDPEWVRRLGQTGKDCYDAILSPGPAALADSMNACMECWKPFCRIPSGTRDQHRPERHSGQLPIPLSGAMYSGCGGGYLMVIAGQDVPGAFRVANPDPIGETRPCSKPAFSIRRSTAA